MRRGAFEREREMEMALWAMVDLFSVLEAGEVWREDCGGGTFYAGGCHTED